MAKKKTIEQKYKKLDAIQHVLLRPGRYIGSVTPHTDETYVVNEEENKIIKEEITWNPGLIKIFDEIISNSVDESKREDSKLNTIKVTIDKNNKRLSIWDNGGIPVVIHGEHNVYVPSLIFGELHSGSNFDDDDESCLTGQNGEGSVLTNIFSTMFKVETADGKNKFTQTFKENNQKKTKPKIEECDKNFTKITFDPDYEKLSTDLDEGNYKKIVKRVYDVAGCNPKLKVYLNGKQIRIKSFKDYVALYTDDYLFEENDDWKIAIARTDNGFEQISFVNGTEALDLNSTHVNYIANQITTKIREFFNKKHKVDVKPSEIKNHLKLFIDARIVNPRYSSQTKEKLITEISAYKTEINISDRYINKLLKSEIIQDILDWVEAKKAQMEKAAIRKLNKDLNKGSLKHIIKFSDANEKNDREKCMLMLVEGESAAKVIRAVGDKRYTATYPLKGKVINVSSNPLKKTMANQEIKDLMQIIGLEIGVKVESKDQLRFGKIVFATDADDDGSHIKGLLINFFYHFWPELLDMDILYSFMTPVVKVKPAGRGSKELWFYTLREYVIWAEKNKDLKYTTNYYKGLGTSTSKEFKVYLNDLDKHLVLMDKEDDEDTYYIDLAFNDTKQDNRKEWLDIEE